MKKQRFLIVLMAITLLLAGLLCGCNDSNPEPSNSVTPIEPSSSPAPSVTETGTTPTPEPTPVLTPAPSSEPTPKPSTEPTPKPSSEPTPTTSPKPTSEPTPQPTSEPTPTPQPTAGNQGTSVIAGGLWDGGPVKWEVTSDGTLTISGNRGIQGSTTYFWKDYSNVITRIVIEDGITSIPKNAFSQMTNVTSVYLGNTLTKIYESAFYGCTSLQSITIPAGITVIPSSAFSHCSSLTSLNFAPGSSLATISGYAFYATSITEFVAPPSLTLIDFHAFEECRSLQSINLQNFAGRVCARSFDNCVNLKHIVFGPNTIVDDAFAGCNAIETLSINNVNIPSFQNQTNLRSVTIGANATHIGSWFQGCTALSSVTITSPVTQIRSSAFRDCVSLQFISLPNTLTEIQGFAFMNTGLTSITIPASVTSIGASAFSTGTLREITFKGNAPAPVYGMLSGVTATVYYPAENTSWTEDALGHHGGTLTWVPQ